MAEFAEDRSLTLKESKRMSSPAEICYRDHQMSDKPAARVSASRPLRAVLFILCPLFLGLAVLALRNYSTTGKPGSLVLGCVALLCAYGIVRKLAWARVVAVMLLWVTVLVPLFF